MNCSHHIQDLTAAIATLHTPAADPAEQTAGDFELTVRWIGITSLEQDIALGRIAPHNRSSSEAELRNRRRVYAERLLEFQTRHGAAAAERLKAMVEQEPARPAATSIPDMPAQSRRHVEWRLEPVAPAATAQGRLFDLC